jgi:ABC-type Na+ efflux pump permease subunit
VSSSATRATDRGAYLLVARREFVERARDRSFKISTGVTITFLAGFILLASFGGGGKRYDVAVVGAEATSAVQLSDAAARALGFSIEIRPYPTASGASAAVRNGVVDAAFVQGAIVVKSAGAKDLVTALQLSAQQISIRRALAEAGLSAQEISDALNRPPPPVRSLEPAGAIAARRPPSRSSGCSSSTDSCSRTGTGSPRASWRRRRRGSSRCSWPRSGPRSCSEARSWASARSGSAS